MEPVQTDNNALISDPYQLNKFTDNNQNGYCPECGFTGVMRRKKKLTPWYASPEFWWLSIILIIVLSIIPGIVASLIIIVLRRKRADVFFVCPVCKNQSVVNH
jgi:predicted RNA-binding Zn-ribbon protein involved in translation (DUF1610 family)